MKVDTSELYRQVNSDLVRVQRAMDDGMFPQVRDEQRAERDELRRIKTALVVVENYAMRQPSSGGGEQ
jgi:hypothetical protein